MTREHFEADQRKFKAAAETIQGGIGFAVDLLRKGERVRRAGWNGKGMSLYYVVSQQIGDSQFLPYVVMVTAQGTHVPWVCSQTDMLAQDWEEVPEGE